VVWEYGAMLTQLLQRRQTELLQQAELRQRSSGLVSSDDIKALDQELLSFVAVNRGKSPLLIDSHPVTKESFGYRTTAFSSSQILDLRPDEIWVLYSSPEETVRRIEASPNGRPQVTCSEAAMHTSLQASVAVNYGIIVGCPIYFFDTEHDPNVLTDRLEARIK
jgi:adenylate kinase